MCISCHSLLERRLGKLEGRRGGRTELTSKDILQSLSEAKEDHIMVQRGTEVGQNGPSSWSNSGRESPFSIRNEFADVDLGGGGEGVEVVSGRRRRERVGIEGGEERPVSGASIWTCCLRCQGIFSIPVHVCVQLLLSLPDTHSV